MTKDNSPEALINAVTEKVTLNIFRVGSEKSNYIILRSLPNSVKKLQEKLEITKMPINKRINELAGVGLLTREKYEGEVKPTSLTRSFIETIENIKKDVVKELPKLI